MTISAASGADPVCPPQTPFAAAVELRIVVGHSLSRSPLKAMIVMDSGSVLTWFSIMGPPQDKDDARCPDSRKQGLPVISQKNSGN